MPGPWEKYGSAPHSGGVFTLPPDPAQVASEQRSASDQQMQLQRFQWEKQKHDEEVAQLNGGNIPGDEHAVGNDYLKTLPTEVASQVRALAEGRMAFPTGRAASSPYWQQRMAAVAQYDPEFDTINFNARASTRKDFTAGKAANNIRALNTAIGHLGHLADQIGGTASHGGFPGATAANAVQNAFQRSSGAAGVTQFEQTAGALAGELTQVYRASGGAEADIQRYLGELNVNGSGEQKHAAVANIMSLLMSRLDALNDQYDKGMGVAAGGLSPLDPRAKAELTKYLPGFEATKYGEPNRAGNPGLVGSVTDDSPPVPGNNGGDGYQNSYVGQGMSGVNEGIASTLGFPVDAATAAINLIPKGINAAANTNLPMIEDPVGGSGTFRRAMDGWGIYDPSSDPSKQFATA